MTENFKTAITAGIASVFFLIAALFETNNHSLGFATIISYGLYFLVFLEIARASVDFLFSGDHRIKVKYIFDMGIIFVVREILVTSTLNHESIDKHLSYLYVMFGTLTILSTLRYIDYLLNPKENCPSPEHNGI